ncbi:MAG: hypothetical protein ABJE66_34435 [Deltaproteobacteria bacterium]
MKLLALLLLVAGCDQEVIGVKPTPQEDYNHAKLVAAVDTFIAAQRTPVAYGELAKKVTALRPGMDATVAAEAERRMVVLALAPETSVKESTTAEQINALALTVWPTLLTPPIEADQLMRVRDPKMAQIPAKPGEDPSSYILRLCQGPLVTDCKHAVPELQGEIVAALAIRRATERARIAVSECLECSSEGADPGWKNAVAGWEQLDRVAAETITDVEAKADPDNWPVAGGASDDDPQVPEAELTMRGDIVVNGHGYGPNQQRIDVLKELRGKSDVIALHFHPDQTLAQVRAVLVDARKSGAQRVAVVAREPVYPYRRRVYWVADGSGLRANLRPTDSLQLLLHAVDEVAGPGTVARVD